MLKEKNRLKKRKDFGTVQGLGRSVKSGILFLKILPNNRNSSRVGFVVSSRFSKKAHERNLMKRKLREAFRKFLPEIKRGYDICVFVARGAGEMDSLKIREATKRALEKAKLMEIKL